MKQDIFIIFNVSIFINLNLILFLFSISGRAEPSYYQEKKLELEANPVRSLIETISEGKENIYLWSQNAFRDKVCSAKSATELALQKMNSFSHACDYYNGRVKTSDDIEKQIDDNTFDILARMYHQMVKCQKTQLSCYYQKDAYGNSWYDKSQVAILQSAKLVSQFEKLIRNEPLSTKDQASLNNFDQEYVEKILKLKKEFEKIIDKTSLKDCEKITNKFTSTAGVAFTEMSCKKFIR